MEYNLQKPQITQEYRTGTILGQLCKVQKAMKVAEEQACQARDAGDISEAIYHAFYYGRLCQKLHVMKEEHKLDIVIPEPRDPREERLPSFISRSTTSEFPEVW